MSGPASEAANAYVKIDNWLSPMGSVVDAIMRPIVEPFAEMLEFVTGDPEGIEAAARLWKEQAEALREVIADQRRDRAALANDWEGEAADRLQRELAEYETALEEEADDMENTAAHLQEAAEQCRIAQDLVETVIRELIEWAIITFAASLAFSVLTAGISLAAEAAAAAAEGAIASARIAMLVRKLATALTKVADAMKAIKLASKRPHLNPKKPWTWNKPFDPTALGASMVKKGVGKAALGAVGFTGDPVGETAKTAIQDGLVLGAGELDDRAGPQHPLPTVELSPEERKRRFDQAFG
ncbi:WXG100 family type VII secretion target [Kitasatospora sp. NPDC096147]|uniref:WXG100 family type VII secretion target n=1 Tax=Kitasatospora sp. NPDC096147 TaxID=3364093 RepID=UPI003822896D